VEKRKKGDVLRKARAEGNAARARAPTSDLTMMGARVGAWVVGGRWCCSRCEAPTRRPWAPGTSRSLDWPDPGYDAPMEFPMRATAPTSAINSRAPSKPDVSAPGCSVA